MLPDAMGALPAGDPVETVEHVSLNAPGEFFLNAAPAREHIPAADLTIVNRYELEALPNRDGVIAVTLGAEGAVLLEDGVEVARAAPPPVEAVDGTAAGDAFTACLVVSLIEDEHGPRRCGVPASPGRSPRPVSARRRRYRHMRRSTRSCEHANRHRLRSRARRRDRHPARARVARGRGARHHDRRRQPDAGQDDPQRAEGAGARAAARTSRSPPVPTRRSSARFAWRRTSTARPGSTAPICRIRRRRSSMRMPRTSSPS